MKKYALFLLFAVFGAVPGLRSAGAADAAFSSQYTSLEEPACKAQGPASREPEDDSISFSCPGLEGFEVVHEGGDLRSWLTFKKKGGTVLNTMDGITQVPGSFPHVTGKKLEWRYEGKQLIGWIFRMGANDEAKGKPVSKLMAVRLDAQKACVLGVVDTNEQAQAKLDQSKPCP